MFQFKVNLIDATDNTCSGNYGHAIMYQSETVRTCGFELCVAFSVYHALCKPIRSFRFAFQIVHNCPSVIKANGTLLKSWGMGSKCLNTNHLQYLRYMKIV